MQFGHTPRHGPGKAGCEGINNICEERVGLKYKAMAHAKTSDRAAKVMATMLNDDENTFDIRNCDKIGR